ncbi:MAG: hypothetical protein J2P31_11235 [Blastocatellia bacterium]|nr:hypothetical protein [Blastocatellia bacterium]
MIRDLRYGISMLLRNPGFTAVAVIGRSADVHLREFDIAAGRARRVLVPGGAGDEGGSGDRAQAGVRFEIC